MIGSTQRGAERLREVYAMTAGLPDNRLDLTDWREGGNKPDFAHCGSVGCVIGFACSYPPFEKQGLSYSWGPEYKIKSPGQSPLVFRQWPAVAHFFDISFDNAYSLFMSTGAIAKREDYYRYVDADVVPKIEAAESGFSHDKFQKACRSIGLSDRRLVLMRIRNFLARHGYITAERCQELRVREEQGTIEFPETVTTD